MVRRRRVTPVARSGKMALEADGCFFQRSWGPTPTRCGLGIRTPSAAGSGLFSAGHASPVRGSATTWTPNRLWACCMIDSSCPSSSSCSSCLHLQSRPPDVTRRRPLTRRGPREQCQRHAGASRIDGRTGGSGRGARGHGAGPFALLRALRLLRVLRASETGPVRPRIRRRALTASGLAVT